MDVKQLLSKLESLGSPENVVGMARFGIVTKKAFGVPAADLKQVAKEAKKETKDRHSLALELWKTGIHDARAGSVSDRRSEFGHGRADGFVGGGF